MESRNFSESNVYVQFLDELQACVEVLIMKTIDTSKSSPKEKLLLVELDECIDNIKDMTPFRDLERHCLELLEILPSLKIIQNDRYIMEILNNFIIEQTVVAQLREKYQKKPHLTKQTFFAQSLHVIGLQQSKPAHSLEGKEEKIPDESKRRRLG